MTGQTGDEQQQRKAPQTRTPLSDSKNVHLTLYKWWPGGTAASNQQPRPEEAVQRAVDELGPYLKRSTRAELTRSLKARKKEDSPLTT